MNQEVIQEISRIWFRLLGEQAVSGIDSSFFESGGNSMLAVRMLAQVMELFKIQLDLEPFFKEPTIRVLAFLVSVRINESEQS